ncbi:hypothetical protein E1B28_003610 [Marasmius oreades]|uniref:F-box domain-containing protein n=1 Tax=Marasmius oreades TaxID=181124 RepID=A0A9P7RMX8_9AGAR|nr:uncharacterized protein E1B28_003610 [Marasmius oreades]KAG7086095.1 hypothetical protein E1B28_003610 [Marasmius oreades]
MEQEPCERCQTAVDLLHPIDPEVLHSNYVPSETEVTFGLQELNQCEAKITDLRRQLEQLEVRRLHCRSIVSAHRRVPVEIWEIIIILACSSDKNGYSLIIENRSKNNLVKVPITLSHVCSRWRTIVVGFPSLWSSISINFDSKLPMGSQNLLETFLTNSADCPLDIRIVTKQLLCDWSENRLSTLKNLTCHFPRCNRLSIYTYDNTLFNGFQGLHLTFHNLLSLRLAFQFGRLERDNPVWHALLRSTSKLTKATILVNDPWYPRNLLPYQQLTTLTTSITAFGRRSVGDLLRALEACNNLRSLTLLAVQRDIRDYSLEIASRHVVMPSLQTLVIRIKCCMEDTECGLLRIFLLSLVVPNVSSFELRSSCSCCKDPYSSRTTWQAPSLLTMLQQTSTSLQHMSLNLTAVHIRDAWEPLSSVLKATPHLTHFEIGGGQVVVHDYGDHRRGWDTFTVTSSITALTDTSRNTLLPNLECLTIHHITMKSEDMCQILALAASRSPSRFSAVDGIQHPLTKLRIVCHEHVGYSQFQWEPHMLEMIRELEADGVKVVFERTEAYDDYDPTAELKSSFEW